MIWKKFTGYTGRGRIPVVWLSLTKTYLYFSQQTYDLLGKPTRVWLFYDDKRHALKLQRTDYPNGFKVQSINKNYAIQNTHFHTFMPIGRYTKYRYSKGWIFLYEHGVTY